MRIRRFLGLSVLILTLACAALAQDPSPSPSPASSAPEKSASKTSVYGEIAVSTMYHGMDVGGDFCRCTSPRAWVSIERQFTPRFSGYVNFWGQNSKSPADEFDSGGGFTFTLTGSTAFGLDVANFKVHKLSVRKVGFRASKSFEGKVPLTLLDELTWFGTSQPQLLKGGVMNKVTLSARIPLPKDFTLSGGPSISVDNGPFALGGPAAMFFLQGRLQKVLNKHWSAFAAVKHSRPIAGETIRRPIYSGEFGLAFRY